MENSLPSLNSVQKTVWEGELPLELVLDPSESRVYDKTEPYLVCTVAAFICVYFRSIFLRIVSWTLTGSRYPSRVSLIYPHCSLGFEPSSHLRSLSPLPNPMMGGSHLKAFH